MTRQEDNIETYKFKDNDEPWWMKYNFHQDFIPTNQNYKYKCPKCKGEFLSPTQNSKCPFCANIMKGIYEEQKSKTYKKTTKYV